MKIARFLAATALLCASASASATLYEFSYTFNGGDVSLSGIFDGTASGDIITIKDFQSFSFTSPLISLTSEGEVGFGAIWPPVAPYTSFSGAEQNFAVGYSTPRSNIYFDLFALAGRNAPSQSMTFENLGWMTPEVRATDSPANTTWKVAAVVPEPATYGMLLAGLGIVGALARRRSAA